MNNLLLFAFMVIVLNVLDSVTTHIGFKQYPEKDLKGEANPIMRFLMLKKWWLAEAVKQVGVLGLILGYWFVDNGIVAMRLMTILLGLVVLNNSYIVIVRALFKRKVISPLKFLQNLLSLPDKFVYIFAIMVMSGLTLLIHSFIFGI